MNATFAILSVAMSSVWLSLIAGEVVALLEALGHIWGFDTVRGQRWVTVRVTVWSLVLSRAVPGIRKLGGRHLPSSCDAELGCNPELDLHPAIHAAPSAEHL